MLILLIFLVLMFLIKTNPSRSLLSNINPNLTAQSMLERIKGLTNSWTEDDKIFFHEVKFYNQNVKNNFLRNDNWYNTLIFSLRYSESLPAGSKKLSSFDTYENFENFENLISKKNYNNIYIIINESYPNFRNQDLKKKLFEKTFNMPVYENYGLSETTFISAETPSNYSKRTETKTCK